MALHISPLASLISTLSLSLQPEYITLAPVAVQVVPPISLSCQHHPLVADFGTTPVDSLRFINQPGLGISLIAVQNASRCFSTCLVTGIMVSPIDDHPALSPDTLAAFTAALAALKPNPPTITLKMLTFKWSAYDQYEEFQLFHESLTTWFHLQGMPAKPRDNGDM